MEESRTHVELGDDVEYEMKGKGNIMLQIESGALLEARDVLYVPELKNNLLSVLVLEEMDFVVTFQKGKVLICSEGDIPDTTMSIGIKEGKLYRLQVHPVRRSKGILDHGSMSVTED
jgi:hypothetical protein